MIQLLHKLLIFDGIAESTPHIVSKKQTNKQTLENRVRFAHFLRGLLFYRGDGDSTFLRNVSRLLSDYISPQSGW
jgi:hypothetical protein